MQIANTGPTSRQSQRPRAAVAQLKRWAKKMKIEAEFTITGRGHGILTDEAFTSAKFAAVREKKKILIAAEGRLVELQIKSAEVALKSGGREFLAFIVPAISDANIREFILGREIELA